MPWLPLEITIKWPPYFGADPEEQASVASQARDDLDAGLVTLKSAVERIAPHYGIEKVDAYLEELIQEKADRVNRAMQTLTPESSRRRIGTAADDGEDGDSTSDEPGDDETP